LGPGEYFKEAGLKGKKLNARAPFLSSNTRFEKIVTKVKIPGPGTYDLKTNIRDRVIDKIRLGYRGNFGTTDRRFKQANTEYETPGPGTYMEGQEP